MTEYLLKGIESEGSHLILISLMLKLLKCYYPTPLSCILFLKELRLKNRLISPFLFRKKL